MTSFKGSCVLARYAWVNEKVEENVLISIDGYGAIKDIKIGYELDRDLSSIKTLSDEVRISNLIKICQFLGSTPRIRQLSFSRISSTFERKE